MNRGLTLAGTRLRSISFFSMPAAAFALFLANTLTAFASLPEQLFINDFLNGPAAFKSGRDAELPAFLKYDLSAAAPGRVFVKAPKSVLDGETVAFEVETGGEPAVSYRWSYEAAGRARTAAVIEFSSTAAAATTIVPYWYAGSGDGCEADFSSRYLIRLSTRLASGEEFTETVPLTVEVPRFWGGTVRYPETSGEPEIGFDEARGSWRVTGPGTLERVLQEPVLRVLETSQFYRKIRAHEEVHARQFADGIFADLFQIGNLLPRLAELSDPDRQQLEQKIFCAVQDWRKEEQQTAAARMPQAEKEAYEISDKIEPHYLFNNCSRF